MTIRKRGTFGQLPHINVDPITNSTLHRLYKMKINFYAREMWLLDTDVILLSRFLHIKNMQ
jgi:hypothetical protein